MTARLNLKRNAAAGVVEVVLSGVALFLLYRLVVAELGLKSLGIWSLVVATTSIMRFGDIGTNAGLGRFIAAASDHRDSEKLQSFVDTALLTNLLLYSCISVVLYFPAYQGLALVVSDVDTLAAARGLLPLTMVSFTVSNLANATTASIVGLQRSDLKSWIVIGGVCVQMIFAVATVGTVGVLGLAIAQIAQSVFVLLAGWIVVHKLGRIGSPLRIPRVWQGSVFRDIVGYGVKLQSITIVNFISEPAIKFVLSSVGGLETLGLFELAQRLVLQTRQLVAMPTQTLMPAFAYVSAHEPSRVAGLYRSAVGMTVAFGVPLFGAMFLVSPAIGFFWLGHLPANFLVFVGLLSAGWLINLCAAPAYLMGVGTGKLRWNLIGGIISSIGGPALGLVLGHATSAIGVVAAAALMQAVGSVVSMSMNCRSMGLKPMANWSDIAGSVQQLRPKRT